MCSKLIHLPVWVSTILLEGSGNNLHILRLKSIRSLLRNRPRKVANELQTTNYTVLVRHNGPLTIKTRALCFPPFPPGASPPNPSRLSLLGDDFNSAGSFLTTLFSDFTFRSQDKHRSFFSRFTNLTHLFFLTRADKVPSNEFTCHS